MGRESRDRKQRKCRECSHSEIETAAELLEHVSARHHEASPPRPPRKLHPDDIWDRVPRSRRYGHRKTNAEREAYLRAKAERRAA